MSTQAAAATTPAPTSPAGASAGVTPPAAGTAAPVSTPAAPVAAPETKPAASILGDAKDPAAKSETKGGSESTQTGGSKDGKPDAVALEIKLPEGVQVDAKELDAYKAIATEANLSQEQANVVAAKWLEHQKTLTAAQVDAWDKQGEAWANELQTWLNDPATKKDPDFAGMTIKDLEVNAKKGLRFAGGDKAVELAQAINELGIGNHPALVRAFAKIGLAKKEDSSATDGGTKPPPASDEQTKLRVLYPSMFNEDGSPKRAV